LVRDVGVTDIVGLSSLVTSTSTKDVWGVGKFDADGFGSTDIEYLCEIVGDTGAVPDIELVKNPSPVVFVTLPALTELQVKVTGFPV